MEEWQKDAAAIKLQATWRGKQVRSAKVTAEDTYTVVLPEGTPNAGFTPAALPPLPSVKVAKVSPNSWAEKSGVKVGDKLLKVGEQMVSKMAKDDFLAAVKERRPVELTFAHAVHDFSKELVSEAGVGEPYVIKEGRAGGHREHPPPILPRSRRRPRTTRRRWVSTARTARDAVGADKQAGVHGAFHNLNQKTDPGEELDHGGARACFLNVWGDVSQIQHDLKKIAENMKVQKPGIMVADGVVNVKFDHWQTPEECPCPFIG
ncbi:unnamed protein product [Symbiodinium natans]|uniref:PDZ domain-containing protein n=1 Tax=Symbiodinium natans TaxID=878477 RepID=A0A812V294_9DINO|nr:unnamed protein product [Symbiodinium natans]